MKLRDLAIFRFEFTESEKVLMRKLLRETVEEEARYLLERCPGTCPRRQEDRLLERKEGHCRAPFGQLKADRSDPKIEEFLEKTWVQCLTGF